MCEDASDVVVEPGACLATWLVPLAWDIEGWRRRVAEERFVIEEPRVWPRGEPMLLVGELVVTDAARVILVLGWRDMPVDAGSALVRAVVRVEIL